MRFRSGRSSSYISVPIAAHRGDRRRRAVRRRLLQATTDRRAGPRSSPSSQVIPGRSSRAWTGRRPPGGTATDTRHVRLDVCLDDRGCHRWRRSREGFTTVQARDHGRRRRGVRGVPVVGRLRRGAWTGLMGVTDLGAAAGWCSSSTRRRPGRSTCSRRRRRCRSPGSTRTAAGSGRPRWNRASTRRRRGARCTHRAERRTRVAVEAFAGGLESLLLVDGSVIELLAGTETAGVSDPLVMMGVMTVDDRVSRERSAR